MGHNNGCGRNDTTTDVVSTQHCSAMLHGLEMMEDTVLRRDAYDVMNVVFGAGEVGGFEKQKEVT